MTFSPDYIRLVLHENFEDAKTLWLTPMMAMHESHLVMLADTGIVSRDVARTLRDALAALDRDAVRRTVFDGQDEDLFLHVDRLLAEACTVEVAGRLHTARSRNDVDMTLYRMRLREDVLGVMAASLDLRRALVDLASRHGHSVFPAHTHTQPAQPTTVAHYLLAVIEEMERAFVRLSAAYDGVNRNPLGACAITGTGFPISRERTSALLGFDGPTGNTYGSIATVDYLLESAGATGTLLVSLGRVTQDLLLWATAEVGYLRLPDGLVQASSIMPQKRNPVALEHTRSLASRALAQLAGLPLVAHNTPFGDIVDTEDDLQPLAATAFRDARRAVALLAIVVAGAELDVARMRVRAGEQWVTVTELADTLAREHGLPFKVAHGIARAVVQAGTADPAARLADVVGRAAREQGYDVAWTDADVQRVLSPDHFVAVRETLGGPAPVRTSEALEEARTSLARDDDAVSARREALARADAARAASLLAL